MTTYELQYRSRRLMEQAERTTPTCNTYKCTRNAAFIITGKDVAGNAVHTPKCEPCAKVYGPTGKRRINS
jgi:hypothetical protein